MRLFFPTGSALCESRSLPDLIDATKPFGVSVETF